MLYTNTNMEMVDKDNWFEVERVTFDNGGKGVAIVIKETDNPMVKQITWDMDDKTVKKLIGFLQIAILME